MATRVAASVNIKMAMAVGDQTGQGDTTVVDLQVGMEGVGEVGDTLLQAGISGKAVGMTTGIPSGHAIESCQDSILSPFAGLLCGQEETAYASAVVVGLLMLLI